MGNGVGSGKRNFSKFTLFRRVWGFAPNSSLKEIKRGGSTDEDHSVRYSAAAIPGAVQRV
jgi:hypothetical protein